MKPLAVNPTRMRRSGIREINDLARSMTEVARLEMPQRVPFGVHACWLDEAKLDGMSG